MHTCAHAPVPWWDTRGQEIHFADDDRPINCAKRYGWKRQCTSILKSFGMPRVTSFEIPHRYQLLCSTRDASKLFKVDYTDVSSEETRHVRPYAGGLPIIARYEHKAHWQDMGYGHTSTTWCQPAQFGAAINAPAQTGSRPRAAMQGDILAMHR